MRKSCVIYAEWTDTLLNLPDDMAGEYMKAILQYAIYGDKYDVSDPILKAMLVPIFKRLDEDAEAWEETKRQRAESGRKGAAARWHNGVVANDSKPMANDSKAIKSMAKIAVNVNDNVNVNVNKNKKSSFSDFNQRTINYEELKKVTNHV